MALKRFLARVTLGHSIPGCLETPSVPSVRILGSKMSPAFIPVLALPYLMTLKRTLCSTVLGIKGDAISETMKSTHAKGIMGIQFATPMCSEKKRGVSGILKTASH